MFGVHGFGGATGTLLAGVFAVAAVGDTAGLLEGNARQMLYQVYGIVAVLVWSGIGTFVILKVINLDRAAAGQRRDRANRPRHHAARQVHSFLISCVSAGPRVIGFVQEREAADDGCLTISNA